MQAEPRIVKYILPLSHFPTFLGFKNSLGSSMLPSRSIIQSPETGLHNVPQMQNLSPSSEEGRSVIKSHGRKGKIREAKSLFLIDSSYLLL